MLKRKAATTHKESRAKTARHLRVSDAKPPLQNLTKAMRFEKHAKLSFGSEASPLPKGILYRKALRTVSDR